jgi:hypothetical protein
MSPKWEYKVVYIDTLRWTRTGLPADINQNFDEWGAQGWELVATKSIIRKGWFIYGSETAAIVAFLKRKLDT